MSKKDKVMSERGKLGANKRWASRYQMLVELTKHFGKDHQIQFLNWPNKYLAELIRWVENQRKTK